MGQASEDVVWACIWLRWFALLMMLLMARLSPSKMIASSFKCDVRGIFKSCKKLFILLVMLSTKTTAALSLLLLYGGILKIAKA